MRPEEYFAIVSRRWWLPVAGAIMAALVAYVWTFQQPVVYEASTRVMAIAAPGNGEQIYWIDLYAKNRLESYRQLAVSDAILRAAVERGQLDIEPGTLRGLVATRHNPNDNTVQLAVQSTDPVFAARAANAIAEALLACLNSDSCALSPAAPQVVMVRLDEASPSSQPTGARPRLNAAGGGVLGLVAGVLLAVLLEYLDDTLRTPADLRRNLGLGLIARLPQRRVKTRPTWLRREENMMKGDAGRLTVVVDPQSRLAEAYRLLRTSLLTPSGQPHRSLLVAGIGDDRASEVVANLALATAQAGVRTIIIDANLRDPQQHQLFRLPNEKGLTTALTTDQPPQVVATGYQDLSLVTAGAVHPYPSELLASQRFHEVHAQLRDTADVVIFDAPPLGSVADGTVLATSVDGVVLVVRSGRTKRAVAQDVRDMLERVGAPVLGVVLIEQK